MTPTPIYQDHTGQWREQNPFPEFNEYCIAQDIEYSKNPKWEQFEQSITYHPFPNEPNVKQGEVVMAYLQWQEYNGMSHTWQNTDNLESHAPKRQIWVAANQSNQEGKEEQDYSWCKICNKRIPQNEIIKGIRPHEYLHDTHPAIHTLIPYEKQDLANGIALTIVSDGNESPSASKVEVSAEEEITAQDILDKQYLHWMYPPNGDWSKPLLHDNDCQFCKVEDKVIEAMEQYATLKTSSLQQSNQALEGDNYILTQSLAEWKERAGELEQSNDKLQAQSTKSAKEIVGLREEVEKILEVFKWLMGYYDFPEPPKEGRPRYYWRPYLQAKLKEIGIDIHGCKSPFQPRETDNQS